MRRWVAAALTAAACALSTSCAFVSAHTAAPGLRPGVDVPSQVGEVAPAPLGKPGLAPYGDGGYAFMLRHDDGSPVAFDPCRPVHYVIRPQHAPQGGEELLRWAFRQLTQTSGLQFVYDGPSDEPPNPERSAYQRERYGDRWAPVLVVWSTPDESPMLTDAGTVVLGRAGPDTFGTTKPGTLRYVTGIAVFNGPEIDAQLRTGDDAKARAVLLHELGHLVGLAHVGDPYQVMFETNAYPLADYRAGDRRGLAQLGAGPCFRDY